MQFYQGNVVDGEIILEGYHTYFWRRMRYNGLADMERPRQRVMKGGGRWCSKKDPDQRVEASKNHYLLRFVSPKEPRKNGKR